MECAYWSNYLGMFIANSYLQLISLVINLIVSAIVFLLLELLLY